ncbi:MAG: hypothetical protein Q8S03_04325 [Brevundimonas sp.]|uniref:rhamnosyltransferase WsaF family glycosyltransferase n=1 Tax=Brevundimonas sp. TaxID=1871086 RepID=UPI0027377879|nr:hypothetical protein [Brevundimonas sp.]MDP3403894.1 hypothetical protein [Brevundimonas sp.]
MTDAAVKIARFARRLIDGVSQPRATGNDRARARAILFPRDMQQATPFPDERLSLSAMVRAYLDSSAFAQSTVSAAMSRDRPGMSDIVAPEELAWGRKRLPLTAETRKRLAGTLTRGGLLAALFADPVFLEAVKSERPRRWSNGIFLPRASPSAKTRRFITLMLRNRSPLISRSLLAQWGLDGRMGADDLYRYGELAWFRANDLFNAAFYARTYDTGVTNYFDNLLLYADGGEAAGRCANPFLNTRALVRTNPDLFVEVQAGRMLCCLESVIERDAVEQKSSAVHFDLSFYNKQVGGEERRRYSSAFAHYVNDGWKEGVEPNPCFDAIWYLRNYPDALRAVRDGVWPNAFSHFVMEGESAGHHPNAFFDPAAYARVNRDIGDDNTTTPFRHFWQQGRFEGRDYGRPDTAPVVRHFYRRLPDSRDAIQAGALVRLSGRPQDVLAEASRAEAGPSLVSVLRGGRAPNAVGAITESLRQLGRPRVNIEVGRHHHVHAGDATRLYISGLATFGTLELLRIRAVSDRIDADCEVFRYHRLEEVEAHAMFRARPRDLKAGFMAWFDFAVPPDALGTEYFDLEFEFGEAGNKRMVVTHETIHVQITRRPAASDSKAKVQVAMASYNPPEKPFAAQVETILANPGTHLLISDDSSPASGARVLAAYVDQARIDLDVNSHNLNFIANFERSLYMRSESAEIMLFADQDDIWRAEKVETLIGRLEPGVACVFSDMRIVKGDGEVISDTFWQGRRVHHADPLTLGVANTVTGAAAAFPIWLAELMTPFPRYMGVYHDQWLSVLAAAAGKIDYVSAPLYDYVQHGANVLGFSGSRSGTEAHWQSIARRLRSAVRRGRADRRDLAYVEVALASTIPLLQRFVLLHEALLRVPVWREPKVQAVARMLADAIKGRPYDPVRLLRAWRRLARRAGGVAGLMNADDMFIAILTARALIDQGTIDSRALKTTRDEIYWARQRQRIRDEDPDSSLFERKTEGLTIRQSSASGPLRVNMFLPELQLGTFFGGYHSKISLISRLQARGVKTRLILVDQPVVDYDGIARIVGAFPELEGGLMRSEIEAQGSRTTALEIGSHDALLATTWWSAHIVNAMRTALGRERFLYFIQEFEPFTFDLGTNYRGAELTYDFPHDAIFSTEILRDYFVHAGAGVYGPRALKDASALAFRNPITGLKGIARRPRSGRRPRLLFYARPQAHASRNMYEFGVAALRQVVEDLGPELDGWDLVGVGASENAVVKLGGGRVLRLISKLDSAGYRDMLAGSDVGLALMYTPHPSLVPLEMAAAGLVTVTNACMTKTRAAFAGISDLIDVADPEVPMIARSLMAAIRRVNAGPVPHEPIDWPVSPEEAFPDPWLDTFITLATRSLGPQGVQTAGAVRTVSRGIDNPAG